MKRQQEYEISGQRWQLDTYFNLLKDKAGILKSDGSTKDDDLIYIEKKLVKNTMMDLWKDDFTCNGNNLIQY